MNPAACFLLLAVFHGLPLSAHQSAVASDIQFRRISTEHGLSHPNVRCIHQDKLGFLWFGTEDGLNRFDGYDFKVFRPEPQGDPDELRNYDVHAIYEDDEGYLWIGGNFSRRLDRFDPRTHSFEHHRAKGMGHVSWFLKGDGGVVWIGTSWTGLWQFRPESNLFKHYPLDVLDTKEKRAGAGSIYRMFATEADPGTLWLATARRGLVRFDVDSGGLESINDNEDIVHKVPPPIGPISFLAESENVIWIGSHRADTKLYRFDTESLQFLNAFSYERPDDGIYASSIHLLRDHGGRIWAGIRGGGVAQFHQETGEFDYHLYDAKSDRTLGSNIVRQLYQDRSGLIWAITPPAGVSVFDPRSKWLRHYEPMEPEEHGSPLFVQCFHRDSEGAIWLGTISGLAKWNRGSGVEKFYRADEGRNQGLPYNMIRSLGKRQQGGFWIGGRRGLRFFDPQSVAVRFFEATVPEHKQLEASSIHAIYEDKAGELWLGRDSGLLRVDFEAGSATFYQHDPTNARSISGGPVTEILEDRSGQLWIASRRGLECFDRETQQFTRYFHDPSDASTLSGGRVSGLHEDSTANVLWVSTEEGLSRLDTSTGTVRRFTKQDGLPSNAVYGATEDRERNLWANTGRGLVRISERNSNNPRILSFQSHLSEQFVEPQKGQLVDEDGRIYFGRLRGLMEIQPDAVGHEPPATVVLTDFRLLDKSIRPSLQEDAVISAAISYTDSIQLNHKQNKVITVQFSSLDSRSPDSVQYAYRLEGLEDDWNYSVGQNRSATYSTLRPGSYTFRVKATNGQGIWGDETTIDLSVLAPWWQTLWFRLTLVLTPFALAFAFLAYRDRSLRERNRLLKASENEVKLRQEAIESSDDGFVIADATLPDLPIIYANRRFEELTGFTADEILGRNCRFLQGTETNAETVTRLREALRAGSRFQGEILNYRKDGSTFWNLLRISPVRDKTGKLTHFVGLQTDVTARRLADRASRQQQDELAHVTRAATLVEIGAALAHELNQPLAAILRNAQAAQRFLDRESPDLTLVREILADIVKDDRRAGEVLARIRQHLRKEESRREQVNMNDVVQDSLTLLRSQLIIEDIDVRLKLAENLPLIVGDAIQLQQVIVNLVLNAAEAMRPAPQDNGQIVIETSSPDHHTVRVSVNDSGPGIDEGELERIFDPFHTTKELGMGVGLSINRTIVESHDGKMWAENVAEGGARFVIAIPAATSGVDRDSG